jgi:hypothetical protein
VLEAIWAQPETRVKPEADFFIWIRRNPLKSPDSEKEMKGNESKGGGLIPRARYKFDGNIAAKHRAK